MHARMRQLETAVLICTRGLRCVFAAGVRECLKPISSSSFFFPLLLFQAAPLKVCVTGAAGQIGYSLLYMIGHGDVFGKDQVLLCHS